MCFKLKTTDIRIPVRNLVGYDLKSDGESARNG